jgi:hypothetical protein
MAGGRPRRARSAGICAGAALSLVGTADTTSASSAAANPVATCGSIIGEATGPRAAGRRLVLGRVSVPPVRLYDPVALPADHLWPYWIKTGMVVRSGVKKVTITVPAVWRSKVAITWGDADGGHAVITFEACPDSRARWFAYAGGFLLNSPSLCVPLIVKVGARSRPVRFGIGTPCPV